MATSRNGRTPESPSTWTKSRNLVSIWIDYLFWNTGSGDDQIVDQDWEEIVIFADSWFEQVSSLTTRSGRTPI